MTEAELAAVISAIAPVVRECIGKAVSDITPRLAAAEARLTMLGDLRDRVVVVETKSAMPVQIVESPPVDIAPVLERLALSEARLKALDDVRDRLVVVETKASIPVLPPAPVPVDLSPVHARLNELDARISLTAGETALTLTKELGALRERVAVVEVRPPVPGPPGEPGPAGKDGADGKDGTPGLSFEGVYQDGKSYDFGQLVTFGGSSWHCNEATTTKPGDGSKAWTLMVKRGRDGKDFREGGPSGLPIVSVGPGVDPAVEAVRRSEAQKRAAPWEGQGRRD